MNDEELMAGARAAFDALDPVPEGVLAAARSALAWRTPAAALAELRHDGAVRPAAGVRGGTGRSLTFGCAAGPAVAAAVEIEVTGEGRHREITGRLVPPASAEIVVRHRDLPAGRAAGRTGPTGMFCLPEVPEGLVSLLFRLPGGASVVTSWVRV
ncbi:hypothetical protein [Actinomadura montaniterrae]|uniref:Uncharacterized protein n=1 Tax=Actinomadura montaniterrae TaxID=1803903 RepID=A0A6L3VJL2_9ACTN|nr:hypothetical protein [Actinomadura montaniterrae]KAB2371171.1 hypothetical protein F9B16_32760 [Actinomadura montaniterrae]